MSKINIFTANATRDLALKVVKTINENNHPQVDEPMSGEIFEDFIELGNCTIEHFSNKEISCQYQKSIRDKKIYIFGSTGTHDIMELLLMIDAAKRAHVKHITIVLPCYGYARQDKKEGVRGPLGAKLVADLLTVAGAHSIIAIDLHADAIEGFFNLPVNHINGTTIFKSELKGLIGDKLSEYVIVSPDAGGKIRAKKMAKKLGLEVVGMDKERSKPGEISKISLNGDVIGKKLVIVDDMVDSAGTLCKASDYLMKEKEATSVIAVCTHPVLTGKAIENIEKSSLEYLFVSDTIPLSEEAKKCSKIIVISSADILAKIIGRVNDGGSMNEYNS